MLPVFGLSLLVSVLLCVHVVRTGQAMYWMWIILAFPWIGALIYFVAVLAPEISRGPTARRLGQGARQALDPSREYRAAQSMCADAPTVANQMRLARAAAALGRHAEAESLYGQAAQGIHAEDPALLLGRAVSLIELGRFAEALRLLDLLGQDADKGRTPQAALALGRAYEGLGRTTEAESAYQWAVERLPGLEALGRHAAFMARTGRTDEAREAIAEMDRRIAKANPQFRKEGRVWRDLAASALAGR
jgi:hypothetical protein